MSGPHHPAFTLGRLKNAPFFFELALFDAGSENLFTLLLGHGQQLGAVQLVAEALRIVLVHEPLVVVVVIVAAATSGRIIAVAVIRGPAPTPGSPARHDVR